MAFDPTVLLEARAAVEAAEMGEITKNELRIGTFDAMASGVRGADGLIPGGIDALQKESAEQTTKVPVYNRIAAGADADYVCTATGTGTTAFQTVTFAAYRESFALNNLDHFNNEVKYRNAFNYLYTEKVKRLYERIQADYIAYLEAQKSTVNSGDYFGAMVGNAKQVALADKDDFFSGADAELRANDYFGPFEMVAGWNLRQQYNKTADQGAGNSTNLQAGLSNFIPRFTSVANGVGVKSTSYFYKPGTVAILPWIRNDFREGVEGNGHVWSTTTLPGFMGFEEGLTVGVKYDESCDTNAAHKEGWSLIVEAAFTHAYDTTAGASPIFKYEQMTS